MLPGTPVAADSTTLDEAIDDFVMALREYGEDWEERLHVAPNHKENWALVCFLNLVTDEELQDWVTGRPR